MKKYGIVKWYIKFKAELLLGSNKKYFRKKRGIFKSTGSFFFDLPIIKLVFHSIFVHVHGKQNANKICWEEIWNKMALMDRGGIAQEKKVSIYLDYLKLK